MFRKVIVFISVVLLIGCSASKQEEKPVVKEEPEVFVFDDVTEYEQEVKGTGDAQTDTTTGENKNDYDQVFEVSDYTPPAEKDTTAAPGDIYIVQLGAFSTKSRAERFISEIKKFNLGDLSVNFDNALNYYLVQLPPYNDRDEAYEIKERLKLKKEFSDVFVKTISAGK